jgi:TPR repeat protein
MASAEVGTNPVSTPKPPTAKTGSIGKLPLSADELDALLSRSSGFLKDGDFAAARILFRRAAESGSAEAALMLGKTFDPLYLNELGAMGIQPDIAQARQWYQKAVELGSEAAAQRLANLAHSGQ